MGPRARGKLVPAGKPVKKFYPIGLLAYHLLPGPDFRPVGMFLHETAGNDFMLSP